MVAEVTALEVLPTGEFSVMQKRAWIGKNQQGNEELTGHVWRCSTFSRRVKNCDATGDYNSKGDEARVEKVRRDHEEKEEIFERSSGVIQIERKYWRR